ncbi:MAG: altronate dehydratase family protein, partial [Porphyromonadaceae bacterium]|nr:altronate dehydratase family protein [Porphyromonadaceae bacterium]
MSARFIKINPADNVAVAVDPLQKGDRLQIDGGEIVVGEEIPAGHKVALKAFAPDEHIIKYGYPIGHARQAIAQGAWVNEKNIKTNLEGLLDYTYTPKLVSVDQPDRKLTFQGYRRESGEVGIRKEIRIIPTVGCVNGVVNQLAEALR